MTPTTTVLQQMRGADAPVHLGGSLVGQKGTFARSFRQPTKNTERSYRSSGTGSSAERQRSTPLTQRARANT
jgi:hypothetical protein